MAPADRNCRDRKSAEQAAFAAQAHRQSLAVAQSPQEREDQAFVDAVSDYGSE